jgi:osmoprotectant transport system ATP-binding protein
MPRRGGPPGSDRDILAGPARDSSVTAASHAHPSGPSASPAEPLEFRAATKRYGDAAQPAVDALSLEVPAGEICVLVGPSGCGKTTAMRMVNRMIDITDGDILLGGRSVNAREPAALRRDIGYVIQQIGLFPHRTIAQNIATVPELLGWDRRRRDERVAELLSLTGLEEDLGSRYPSQLSGGQRQRVGVARALAVDPPVMLMDEPFGAIDPINRERLQNEFLRLQERVRKTIVFVTHDIDEAIKMGDRIAILQVGGRLQQYATPAELLMQPANDFVRDFVGADRALKRLALLRVRDVDLWTTEEVDYHLELDPERRPVAWRDPRGGGSTPVTTVERDDILRDALSDLLQSQTQYGAVVDEQGRLTGILSVELIHDFLVPEVVDGAAAVPESDR